MSHESTKAKTIPVPYWSNVCWRRLVKRGASASIHPTSGEC